ncbi:Serine/threonine-protein kinase 11-interacting protein [Globisporangium polare]
MIQGIEVTGEADIFIDLDPVVAIPIFAASCIAFTVAVGLFAHWKPESSLVRRLDRNFREILIAFAAIIISSIVAFVASEPPDYFAKDPLTIFACCLVAWFSLAALAFWRLWYTHKEKKTSVDGETPGAKVSSRSDSTITKKEKNDDGLVIEIVAEMLRD